MLTLQSRPTLNWRNELDIEVGNCALQYEHHRRQIYSVNANYANYHSKLSTTLQCHSLLNPIRHKVEFQRIVFA